MRFLWFALVLLSPASVWAQTGYIRIPTCNTASPPQGSSQGYMDQNGNICGQAATKPGGLTIIPLDIATVTTGGTAVTALNAGHAAAGGWLATANSAGICVDQVTTAGTTTGTPSSTGCVAQNVPFYLVPSTHAVSVNSSGSSVSLGGEGLQ